MKTLLLVVAGLALSGCRNSEPVPANPTPAAPAEPLPKPGTFALSEAVKADLEKQKAEARSRKAAFESVLESK